MGAQENSSFERRFKEYVDHSINYRLRIMSVLGAFIFTFFSTLDYVIYPDFAYPDFLILRLSGSAVFLMGFAATFVEKLKRYIVWVAFICFYACTLAIHIMLYKTQGIASPYREGITVVFLAWLFVNDYRPRITVLFCILNLATYCSLNTLRSPIWEWHDFALPLYFSGCMLFFVMLLTYVNAKQHRRQFQLREKLRESERKLESNYERVKVQAEHDHLTGVYNRRAFVNLLQQKMELSLVSEKSFYLVFFDIDRFKQINDAYGHLVGDELIKLVVSSVQKKIRSGTEIGRYGGDEFMFIMDEMPEDVFRKRLEDIQEEVKESPYYYKDQIIAVSASFGAVKFDARKVWDPNDLIRLADEAALESKRRERGSIHISNH